MITDLRALELQELPAFTKGLVDQVVARVRDKITHLESSVAVAELTVALHYVLNTPEVFSFGMWVTKAISTKL